MVNKEQLMIDLTAYAFLCCNPSTEGDDYDAIEYAISDVANVDEFSKRWMDLPMSVQAEFGYDLPTLGDGNCVPIEDFSTEEARDCTEHIKEVRSVTFDEYVALVRKEMER
jgi:hypothetical protein